VTYDQHGKKYSPLLFNGDPSRKKPLTAQDVIQHVRGIQPISLYAIGRPGTERENRCQWLAWDFDNHNSDGETHLRNTDYVCHLAEVLRHRLSLDPLVESSDGRGGYHVWVLFNELIPSDLAFRFSHWVVRELCDWRDFLTAAPECIPEHESLTESRKYGSSLRVPGRHPTRTKVWSAVLSRNGDRWIIWPDAADEITTYTGDLPKLIPNEARDYSIPYRRPVLRSNSQVMEELYGPPLAVSDPNSVAEHFNETESWEAVLEPHGWDIVRVAGDVTYWRRPGKHEPGHSATTGYCGDKLYVFSRNAEPFEAGRSFSKFQAHAILNHGGDHKAAEAGILFSSNGGIRELD